MQKKEIIKPDYIINDIIESIQWRSDGAFSAVSIFDNATVGDKFIAVINKKTGKIAVAYNTEFFDIDKKRQWETSL